MTTNISAGYAMRRLTLTVAINVTGIRWLKFRLWLGARILKIGASVIGCSFELKAK